VYDVKPTHHRALHTHVMATSHPLVTLYLNTSTPIIHPHMHNMVTFLQLALWNANGLAQHELELQSFLSSSNIDMILSETHFAQNSYMRIPNYTLYHTTHPAGTARGGTAIILKTLSNITLYPTTDAIIFKQLVCQWKTQSAT
jgi:hypothetical protein